MRPFLFVVGLAAAWPVWAAAVDGPALRVNASQSRHPISPDIYGINDYEDKGLGPELGGGVRRWGGDLATRYHWKLDAANSASDWYFESNPRKPDNALTLPDSSEFNGVVETARRAGQKMMGTIPMIGWLPKSRDFGCSFRTDKYGPQQRLDPYHQECGNGMTPDGRSRITGNDPGDVSAPVDPSFMREWVQYLVKRYGTAERGGVAMYCLDNEPMIWHFVHFDVHPNATTYDEMIQVAIDYGSAVKSVDPTARLAGPDSSGWMAYFYSGKDWQSGWSTYPWVYWGNPVDRKAHGDVPFTDWYLQQMQDYERRTGTRLLDYLDLHAYVLPSGVGLSAAGDEATQAARLKSTRVLWDSDYNPGLSDILEPPRLIPRLREWVQNNYPGTKIAVTEYNWGGLEHINGALAQADVLGIFGRDGLDLASMWGPPAPDQPGAFAFRIYRNYDGIGGSFGETSVEAQSDDSDKVGVFAAERSDHTLTIVAINKTSDDRSTSISVDGFTSGESAQVWRYSPANLKSIVRDNDAEISEGAIGDVLPANSITLFVVASDDKGAKPLIASVVNGASYQTEIAPGTIVAIFGQVLGPAALTGGTVNSASMVETQAAGVRVLFDGIAAPVLYAREDQVGAVVPYAAAFRATTHVQVEYRGRRSVPFEVAVTPVAPGIFTAAANGQGIAAALNGNGPANSILNPALAGSVVVLFATGEGETDVTGVDGRIALDILPKPKATVKVKIGDKDADLDYVGAAPQAVAGALQVNARVPSGVGPGLVPVKLIVGGKETGDGVTIAIR